MSVELHTVRFYNLESKSVKCMSCNEDTKMLAVARCNNTIEIWNLVHTPHIERTILERYEYDMIESLAWYDNRLFSAGSQGHIIEYDLICQVPKSMHPVTSGTCWCMAIKRDKHQIAAGTESGYVNIYDIDEDGIVYRKLLDKQEGRITSIAWDSTGEYVVTGSADTVRVWNVERGFVKHRMATGRSHVNKETIVWCLAVTDDFTIISGDSRGKLCFWNGNEGVNISSCQSHKADVRTICLAEDQSTVYCAGNDPLIASYERVKIRDDKAGKWVKSIQRSIHDHDVYSLAICDKKLYSAGIDGYIALSSYPPRELFKYPPLLQGPAVHLSGIERLLLLHYPCSLVLWRLGKKDVLPPVKLLQWESANKAPIKCSALSLDGRWLVCSTHERFTLFSLNIVKNAVRLQRIKVASNINLISQAMCFSMDGTKLVLGTVDVCVVVIDLTSDNPVVENVFKPYDTKDFTDSIRMLAVSSNCNYIVGCDLKSNIVVWQEDKVYCKLPRYVCPVTALAINPATNELVVIYADHKMVEYSLKKRKFTKFSKMLQEQYPSQWLSRSFPLYNITFDKRNDKIIVAHDDTTLFVINKEKELPEKEAKIPRLKTQIEENSSESSSLFPCNNTPQHAFHAIRRHKHLVYYGSLCEGEMVAVEVSPTQLCENLPRPTLKEKRFGRM